MTHWSITFAALMAVWFFVARFRGPSIAVGAVALLSCLVPTWCKTELLGFPLEVRLAATIGALSCYLLHPQSKYPLRLGIIDFLMLLLLTLNVLSDSLNDGFTWKIFARIYGEWCVPYFAGRLAFQGNGALRNLAPYGLFVAIVLCTFATVEAITAIHPWELIYGQRLDDRIPRTMIRLGLQRAWGPCEHPIYFGMMLLLFLPWLFRSLHVKAGHLLIRLGVSIVGPLGVMATVSRAPILLLSVYPIVFAYFSYPKARMYLVVLIIASIIGGFAAKDQVLTLLHDFGGEKLNGSAKQIIVDGQKVEKTSVMTRVYLLQVFRRAVVRAGVFGFGTESVSTFPVRIPVGPEDSSALKNVWAIDNTYLLLTLRFGWFAGIIFFGAIVMSGYSWIKRTAIHHERDIATCVYLGAALFAVALGLFTVWMPQDISYPLLFLMGGASISRSEPFKSFLYRLSSDLRHR